LLAGSARIPAQTMPKTKVFVAKRFIVRSFDLNNIVFLDPRRLLPPYSWMRISGLPDSQNNPPSGSLIPAIATGIELSLSFPSASFDFGRLAKCVSAAAILAAVRPN
ncbi:MAG: hypothetical protein LAO08_13065, partial [Acidobacteriia bacterium]|nr:hypothetical protein [Terriglobia bacterium]